MLGKHHPNLFVFLSALRKEEVYAESKRRDVDLGAASARKKRKYAQNNTRNERIVRRYGEYKTEQEEALEGDCDRGILKHLRPLGHSARRLYL